MGKPYYSAGNTLTSTTGTTITLTPVGTVKINSVPTSTISGTSGSYSGSVNADYIWTGGTNTNGVAVQFSLSLEATGTTSGGYGSGNSNAGGLQAYGQLQSPNYGYDSRSSPTYNYFYTTGTTPPSMTGQVSLGGNASAYNPNSVEVTAVVIFNNAVVSR